MSLPDPIRRAAELVTGDDNAVDLERRLKLDIFSSIGRIKPALTDNVDFEKEVLDGSFFADLPASLQGIAIARCEGTLAFYQRVGWQPNYLDTPLHICVPETAREPLQQRYHANTLHDLAYVHPKHFEKMLGKAQAAQLWETLKRFTADPDGFRAEQEPQH
ncbi:MAG: hypothetical protein KTR35_14730 [Gammaproteobacteria bacterium]|nr:hypothetical protein [Gammaproteobacteria bacterium]